MELRAHVPVLLGVVAPPEEDDGPVSEEAGRLVRAVQRAGQHGATVTGCRGAALGWSSSVCSQSGGGGCSTASAGPGGWELVSRGSPAFVSGGLRPQKQKAGKLAHLGPSGCFWSGNFCC